MRKKPKYSRICAFTLIELLVVVSIIALLVSILLPALGKAREQSKYVVCKMNQKQLIMAAMMWSEDNEGWTLPQKWDRDDVDSDIYRLNKYLNVSSGQSGDEAYCKAVYLCPALGKQKAETLRPTSDPIYQFTKCQWVNSYGINRYLCGSGPGPGTSGLEPWHYGPDNIYWNKHGNTKMSAIRHPRSAIYFMDSSLYIAWDYFYNSNMGKSTQIDMGRRHLIVGSRRTAGKANIAWCDGSVSGEPSNFELAAPLTKTGYMLNSAYFYGQ